jgi:heat shock protein HslJ
LVYARSPPVVIPGTIITAQFTLDEVAGNTGCNSYSARCQADQGSINIAQVVQTEMACLEPDGVMEQEQRFVQSLQAVSTYQMDGDQLILNDQAGVTRLVMQREP